LNVLVSQRASTLRTFAGDTVLPGGRWEEGDETIEDTARREAFEEVGLPIDKVRAPLLCVLEPYLAGNHVLVFPVVVLLLDNTVQPLLNHAEVSSLFAHPLYGFLTLDRPSKSTSRYFIPPFNDPSLSPILDPSLAPEPTTDSGREPHQTDPHRVKSVHYSLIANFNTPSPSDPYYAYMDVPWSGDPDRRFRMHRFLTGREAGGTYPIYGLTASVSS
jgi:8-oxo-dGTP pyrophosphatase MutT (NUDIX family)